MISSCDIDTRQMNYITSEISLAAYLRMKGVKLASASKSQSGKFEFIFDDKNSECANHFIDFLNGEFNTYDSHLKSLKKMIYSK